VSAKSRGLKTIGSNALDCASIYHVMSNLTPIMNAAVNAANSVFDQNIIHVYAGSFSSEKYLIALIERDFGSA